MISTFYHPISKEPMVSDIVGNLTISGSPNDILFVPVNGCYDFTKLSRVNATEQEHYDGHYGACQKKASSIKLSEESLQYLWNEDSSYKLLYSSVENINGKDILLLGNGTSMKEFRFALGGAHIVYTDLSINAVTYAKRCWENSHLCSKSSGKIQFHAVDALFLPFADDSFDIIYGCAFVHHIQQLDGFFAEIYRCLKKGGKCIFLDDAQSKGWQLAKKTILRPLQIISHRRSGISPEDKLATERGGYSKAELQGLLRKHNLRGLIYKRTMFLERLLRRGALKLLSANLGVALAPLGRLMDTHLLGASFIKNHGLLLVWGGQK